MKLCEFENVHSNFEAGEIFIKLHEAGAWEVEFIDDLGEFRKASIACHFVPKYASNLKSAFFQTPTADLLQRDRISVSWKAKNWDWHLHAPAQSFYFSVHIRPVYQ